MGKFKKGDIVGRISYNKDVIFEISKIIRTSNKQEFAILKGITERIEADSPLEDLEHMDKRVVDNKIQVWEDKISNRNQTCLKDPMYCLCASKKSWRWGEKSEKRSSKMFYTGQILHLDGDKRYSEKSMRYYKSLGLSAVVKNIPENKQAFYIKDLLEKYKPDVLVLTGHDGMIRKGMAFNDIYNYRNSRHFIQTVTEARSWNTKGRDLAIFAGACQSYYEGIMAAGANFASSPARIMIDFIDPLIVAERIATTENTKYLTIKDIEEELRDGEDGVSGIGSMGKKKIIL